MAYYAAFPILYAGSGVIRVAQYTITEIRDVLQPLCSDPRIKRIILFGSHAKGEAQEQSDIDLYLDSGRSMTGFDFFALKACMEDAFQTDVDILLDLDVLPDSPVENEINSNGVTVYAR